jgi:hypothetical protein
MGISPNHFNYYILKQPIKGIYLVINIGGIDVNADYQINKPSVNPKSFPICAVKMDTGVSYEFPSVCLFFFYTKKKKQLQKQQSFLKLPFLFLADVLEKVKVVRGMVLHGKNRKLGAI